MYDRMPIAGGQLLPDRADHPAEDGRQSCRRRWAISRACLRDRKRLHGKIQALSSEAKASAGIIGSLPVVVMGLVYATTPDYIALLFTERFGNFLLAVLRRVDVGRHLRHEKNDQLQVLSGERAHDEIRRSALRPPVRRDGPRRGRRLRDDPDARLSRCSPATSSARDLKAVATRREELRRLQREALNKKGQLRSTPVGFMKQTIEKLNLRNILESPGTKEKLSRAGYRGQSSIYAFMFFRFVMPFIVFFATIVYLFMLSKYNLPPIGKIGIAFGGAFAGFYLPDLYVQNVIDKRMSSVMKAFPDALDLHADLRRVGHVGRSRVQQGRVGNRQPIGRARRRVRLDHRRAVLSAGPAIGVRESRQALRAPRRARGVHLAHPSRALRYAARHGACASWRSKIAKCA